MSFWGSLFNSIASASTEVRSKQQEYAAQYAQMNEYQLKREYMSKAANDTLLDSVVGIGLGGTDSIAQSNALKSERAARGLVISESEYREQYTQWVSKYSGMNIISLSLDHSKVKRQYQEYRANMMDSNSAFYQLSLLKPRMEALKGEYKKRELSW